MAYHYIVTFDNNKKVWVDIDTANKEEVKQIATAILDEADCSSTIVSVKRTTHLGDIADVDYVA